MTPCFCGAPRDKLKRCMRLRVWCRCGCIFVLHAETGTRRCRAQGCACPAFRRRPR